MRLYNQKNAPLSWEARGVTYTWDIFGPCDVPEDLVDMLRKQGFPVDINPVTPKAKAKLAVDEEVAASKAQDVLKLQEQLADAEARVLGATRNAEACQGRESKALEREQEALKANASLTDQLEALKTELANTQKLLVESQADLVKSKDHVQKLQALIDVSGKTNKPKG